MRMYTLSNAIFLETTTLQNRVLLCEFWYVFSISPSNLAKMAAESMNGRNTPTTTLRVTRPIDPFYSNSIVSIFGLPLSFDYAYFLHYSASFGPILEFRSGEFDSPSGRRTFAEVLFQSAQSARAMLQQPGLEVDGVVYKFLPKSNGEVLSNSKGKARGGASGNRGGGRNRRSPWEEGDGAMSGGRSRGSGKRGTMNEGGKGRGGAQSGNNNQQPGSNQSMRMGPQMGQQMGQMGPQMGSKQGGVVQPMMMGQQQQQGMKQQGSVMMRTNQQQQQAMGQPMGSQMRQQQVQQQQMQQQQVQQQPQGMMGQPMAQQGMYQQGMMMPPQPQGMMMPPQPQGMVMNQQPQGMMMNQQGMAMPPQPQGMVMNQQPQGMMPPQPSQSPMLGGLVPSESCVLADDFYAHFDMSMVFGVFRSFGPIAQVVFVSEKCVYPPSLPPPHSQRRLLRGARLGPSRHPRDQPQIHRRPRHPARPPPSQSPPSLLSSPTDPRFHDSAQRILVSRSLFASFIARSSSNGRNDKSTTPSSTRFSAFPPLPPLLSSLLLLLLPPLLFLLLLRLLLLRLADVRVLTLLPCLDVRPAATMVVTNAPNARMATFEVARGVINPITNLPTAKTTPKIQPKTAGNDAAPKNQEEQTTPSDTKTATEDASNPPAETVEQPEDASNPQGEGADSVFQALDEAVLAR